MSFLIDANVLINAFRIRAPSHEAHYRWLSGTLAAGEQIYASAIVEVALLRIMTNPKLGPDAAPARDAFRFIADLHALPNYRRLELEPGEYGGFEQTVQALGLAGNDLNDAYLAVLAQRHDLTLVTADAGFSRFPGLKVFSPE